MIEEFVRDGYVVLKGILPDIAVSQCRSFVMNRLIRRGNIHAQAVGIMDDLQNMDCFRSMVEARRVVDVMRQFLGPDVCMLGFDALWINVPQDRNPVLNKGQHTDAWTGTSVNTIFAKAFLTDCDQYNGVSVSPGSHLQGMIPVRNRAIDRQAKVKFKDVNLQCRAGDWLLWHPLLVHKTTGHSGKNIRISITSRYTSTETAFSSQERALGYRTLSVGPMNRILRLVGNDYLTPLRTYGGAVSVDKRLSGLY